MNDQPIEHTTNDGSVFRADRADLRGGVTVITANYDDATELLLDIGQFIAAVAEFIGWHALTIHPQLNGFQGYDCIEWKLEAERC